MRGLGGARWMPAWAVLILAVGLVPAAQAPDLRIENVSVDRISFRPDTDDPLAIRFRLSTEASVTLRIYDSRDLLIRSLRSDGSLEADGRASRTASLARATTSDCQAVKCSGRQTQPTPHGIAEWTRRA